MAIDELSVEFKRRLFDALEQSRALGYDGADMENMLSRQNAVELAKKLVLSGVIQGGPKKMAKINRKDLTVESIMMDPQFAPLFERKYLEAAEFRLGQM